MDLGVPIKLSGTTCDMGEFLGKNGYLRSTLDVSLTFDTVDSDILLDHPDSIKLV